MPFAQLGFELHDDPYRIHSRTALSTCLRPVKCAIIDRVMVVIRSVGMPDLF